MTYDVVVVGGGLAGLAASIHLSRLGYRVACVEPDGYPRVRLGESLDFSAPAYLKELGISHAQVLARDMGVNKSGVQVRQGKKCLVALQPLPFSMRAPFHLVSPTLHVNRYALDLLLYRQAVSVGTTFWWQRARRFEVSGARVRCCELEDGERLTADWFIDSSGQARVLASAFGIGKRTYGRRKVCLWSIFEMPPSDFPGTTFYVSDPDADSLTWMWEIPITSHSVSVGLVSDASLIATARKAGQSVDAIFESALCHHDRFAALPASEWGDRVMTCSFQNYVSDRLCGENWLMAGESAMLLDPLTQNGVTSAFRHAALATQWIHRSRGRKRLSRRQRAIYHHTFRHLGQWFNEMIEQMVYDRVVRRAVGLGWAVRLYTFLPPLTNQWYVRCEPLCGVTSFLFRLWLLLTRGWMVGCRLVARLKGSRRVRAGGSV